MRPLLFAVCLLLPAACGRPAPEAASGRPPARPDTARASRSTVDSLIAAGELLYRREAYDSARVTWERARGLISRGDSLAEPRLLTWLGLAAWRLGDYPRARSLGERALELKLRRGGPEVGVSYNGLGLLAWNEGRLGDATELFTRAVAAAEREADPRTGAKAALNRGLVQVELGRFGEAERAFRGALQAARPLGEQRVVGAALTNLGMLRVWTGDPADALDYLWRARRHYAAIESPTGEENALGQLGTAYGRLGDLRLGYTLLDSAARIARRQGLREQLAADLELIGDLYLQAGDPTLALRNFAEATALADSLGLAVEHGTLLRKQAAAQAALGDIALALRSASGGRRAHRGEGAAYQELLDLIALVEIESSTRSDDASGNLAEARRLAGESEVPGVRSAIALAEARLRERAGDPRGVLRALQDERDFARMGETEWERHALRARAHARLSNLTAAVTEGRAAVAVLERIRGSLDSPVLRTRYLATKASVYGDLVLALLRQGRVDEAFAVADAARGRALLEHLASVRSDEALDPGLERSRQAQRLLERIDALIARLQTIEDVPRPERGPAEEEVRTAIGRELARSRAEFEALAGRPDARPGTPALGSRAAGEIRASLREGELLVEYLVLPDRLVVFASDRAGTRALSRAVSSEDLSSRIALLRGLGAESRSTSRETAAVSRALYRTLLAPLERAGLLAGRRTLLIVPHGALAYLPFSALQDGNGRALVEDYAIATLPSASSLPMLRGRMRTAGEVPPPESFAPLPGQLPASPSEARMVRARFGGRLRLGSEATERAVREALARGGLVHIATHGQLNADNPLFSRIVLARPGHAPPPADDGRLEVHEVLSMRVSSPLVFLSGCETGLGLTGRTDFSPGEDYTTLAQSFLHAGGTAVIATLWRVEDTGAGAFSERFYGHLRTLPPTEALAAAQRDLRRDARFANPYYWAGYVLTGEGSVRVHPQERGWLSVIQDMVS